MHETQDKYRSTAARYVGITDEVKDDQIERKATCIATTGVVTNTAALADLVEKPAALVDQPNSESAKPPDVPVVPMIKNVGQQEIASAQKSEYQPVQNAKAGD